MTTDARIARRKLSLLELAQDLGNVSKACKLVGYSRQQFYEIRRNDQTFGAEGLVDKVKGPKTAIRTAWRPRLSRRSSTMLWSIRPTGLTVWRTGWRCVTSRSAPAVCAVSGAGMTC